MPRPFDDARRFHGGSSELAPEDFLEQRALRMEQPFLGLRHPALRRRHRLIAHLLATHYRRTWHEEGVILDTLEDIGGHLKRREFSEDDTPLLTIRGRRPAVGVDHVGALQAIECMR